MPKWHAMFVEGSPLIRMDINLLSKIDWDLDTDMITYRISNSDPVEAKAWISNFVRRLHMDLIMYARLNVSGGLDNLCQFEALADKNMQWYSGRIDQIGSTIFILTKHIPVFNKSPTSLYVGINQNVLRIMHEKVKFCQHNKHLERWWLVPSPLMYGLRFSQSHHKIKHWEGNAGMLRQYVRQYVDDSGALVDNHGMLKKIRNFFREHTWLLASLGTASVWWYRLSSIGILIV